MRHIIPISGKDSLCTAIVQMAREPDLPYEFLFCRDRANKVRWMLISRKHEGEPDLLQTTSCGVYCGK